MYCNYIIVLMLDTLRSYSDLIGLNRQSWKQNKTTKTHQMCSKAIELKNVVIICASDDIAETIELYNLINSSISDESLGLGYLKE